MHFFHLVKCAAIAVERKEVNLHGIIAFVNGLLAHIYVVFSGCHDLAVVAPAELQLRSIAAQIITALAAQQLVHRDIEILALDIPQCNINSRNTGVDHRAAALPPESSFVQLVPDDFVIQGIHADHQLCQILYHTEGGILCVAISQSGFAVAIDAFICIDAAENGAPGTLLKLFDREVFHEDVNFCNFHYSLPHLNNKMTVLL